MADNYLEKRYDEVFNGASAPKKRGAKKGNISLDSLLLKNRSYRGYDESYVVSESELRAVGNPRFPRLLPGTLGNFPGCL